MFSVVLLWNPGPYVLLWTLCALALYGLCSSGTVLRIVSGATLAALLGIVLPDFLIVGECDWWWLWILNC